MNIGLWIIAGVLAAAFAASGLMKLSKSAPELVASGQGWVGDVPPAAVKVIGVVEVLAAVGLILPPVLDVATDLVPLAAAGLVVVMIGAAVTHLRRRELPMVGVNVVLGGLALFVAINRFGSYAF